MLHSNIYAMTIHVLSTNIPITREVPIDLGRCNGFIGFLQQLFGFLEKEISAIQRVSKRVSYKRTNTA